jgi:hypothetical protein
MFRAYFHEIRGAFPDGHVSVDEVAAEGETVVVRYTFSGTNTGKLLTMPVTTGKPARFTVVDIWHLTNRKVVEFWESYDRYAMLEQLGLAREQIVALPQVASATTTTPKALSTDHSSISGNLTRNLLHRVCTCWEANNADRFGRQTTQSSCRRTDRRRPRTRCHFEARRRAPGRPAGLGHATSSRARQSMLSPASKRYG